MVQLHARLSFRGSLTDHGKRDVARSMLVRGWHFVGSAILLERRGGDGYVCRHLLCQGIELILKGLLLLHNFDENWSQLRTKYGHKLQLILEDVCSRYRVRPPRGALAYEFSVLSDHYAEHRLRYESGLTMLVNPDTLGVERIMKRLAALGRLLKRHGVMA